VELFFGVFRFTVQYCRPRCIAENVSLTLGLGNKHLLLRTPDTVSEARLTNKMATLAISGLWHQVRNGLELMQFHEFL